MEEKLFEKLNKELESLKSKMRKGGIDYAIDKSYELTTKQEIIDSIQYDHNLSNTEIKALLSKENLLDSLYDDWLDFDGNMREHINYSVDESLNSIVSDYRKEKIKNKDDARWGDIFIYGK